MTSSNLIYTKESKAMTNSNAFRLQTKFFGLQHADISYIL